MKLARVLTLATALFLVSAAVVGCGSSHQDLLAPVSAAGSQAQGNAGLGTVVVTLPLVNARAVKSDVRTFRLTLRQNGAVVVSRDFPRTDQGTSQQLQLTDLAPGEYQLELLYLSDSQTVLGTFRQTISVAAGQTTTVHNPAYQNTVPDFDAPRTVAMPTYASCVASADFNQDGHPDLVLVGGVPHAVPTPGSIFVALGNGDGTFRDPVPVKVGPQPVWAVTGDFNGDHHADIVTANRAGNDLSLVLGNGDGTFQKPVSISLNGGSSPSCVQAADLNHDGVLDLVTANESTGNVSVLLGNGDGTFQPAVNYPTGNQSFYVLAVDVNGDKVPDLVVANGEGSALSVWLGKGDGTFTKGTDISAGDGPLASADFNHDGRPDLVSANFSANTVTVLLSQGSTGFVSNTYQVEATPISVAVGDVDGDGIPDLLVAYYDTHSNNNFSILHGNGDGTFEAPRQIVGVGYSNFATLMDVNGDSHLDIVSAQPGDGVALIALGKGDGTFQKPPAPMTVGTFPVAVATGDLNDDGVPDLVTANTDSHNISVALGQGDGTFSSPASYTVPGSPADVVVGDLNGDGRPDVAVAGTGGLTLFDGNGDGTLQLPATDLSGAGVTNVVAGDFNNDHHLDLATLGSGKLQVFLGSGNGTLSGPVTTDATGVWITAGDFNRDGNLDVATIDSSRTLHVLLGNGDGTFTPGATIADTPGEGGSTFVTSGDLNGDGATDLVVPEWGDGTVHVFLSNGDGTFQSPRVISVGGNVERLLVSDVTGDGIPDLVCTYDSEGFTLPISGQNLGVSVLAGKGDGTFADPVHFYTFGSTFAVAAADLNRDGAVDLVTTDRFSNSVSVLLAR